MALKPGKLAGSAMHTAGIYSDMTVDGPEIGTLVMVVDRAKNLPNRRTMGKQDPYCAARLGKEAKKTETDRRGGQVPRWDQELRFTVRDSPDYHKLKVSVFNEDKRTDLIGETWISLNDVLLPGGGQSDLWHQLEYKGKYAGEIRIELTYYDTRPRAEKAQEANRSRAEAFESHEEPGMARHGPRALPPVKRRPLPSHPNSSPTQLSTPDAAWTAPHPQSGPRHFHTPPDNYSASSPVENQPNIEFRRVESQPEYQTPTRPLPNPAQAYRASHSAPLPEIPSTATHDQSWHQPHHPQIRSQYLTPEQHHDATLFNDPFTMQNIHQKAGTPNTYVTAQPAIRHDRVHALAATGPPRMPPTLEMHHTQLTPAISHQQRLHGPPQPYDRDRNEFYGSSQRLEDNKLSSAQSPSFWQPDNSYYAYQAPSVQESAPPPPSHRYSAPPRAREATIRPTDHSQAQWTHPHTNPTSFAHSCPRPEEYIDKQPGPPAEFLPAGDNPYHWQPAHMQPSNVNRPQTDLYNTQYSREAPVVAYGRRRSEDLITQQTRSSNDQSQPDYEALSRSFPGAQKRFSYDPRIHTLSHPIADTPKDYSQIRPREDSPQYSASTEADSARHKSHNTAPLIKPRALSPGREARHQYPGQKPVIRKSVSPQSMPLSQGSSSASVPFSPDSYDQYNPKLTRSSPSNTNSNPHTPSPLHLAQPSRELETIDGNILTKDGRVIDPSDHLPVNSWAPEPERKNPVPATIKARLGPREARQSFPRTRGPEARENDFAGGNSGGRARLQKRNTSGPLTPTEPNVMNNSTNFSSPYPPPVPAKIPLYNASSGIEDYEPGGKMTALSREMESIDIGPPKKASEVRFGGIGGRARRSRFGI